MFFLTELTYCSFLIEYPGVFNREIQSSKFIKVYFGLAFVVGLMGMIIMWAL